MKLINFLNYAQYSVVKPDYKDKDKEISGGRWSGMLMWREKRVKLKEPFEFPEQPDDDVFPTLEDLKRKQHDSRTTHRETSGNQE